MIEALLTIYLASGAVVERPISQLDCERNLVVASETALSGGYASLDGPHGSFLIVRISCGGKDVILALPPSNGDCAIEGIS